MDQRRMKLDDELRVLLGISRNEVDYIYFQPPESMKIKYTSKGNAIIYRRKQLRPIKADDRIYNDRWEYYITLITRSPDSELPQKFHERFPTASQSPSYVSNNLYHHPFTLTY